MSTNKCLSCGLVNFRSEPRCLRCAATLPSGGEAPFFGCSFCGSQLSVTDQNCPACDTPVRAKAEPQRTAPTAAGERQPRPPQRNLSPCPDCGHMVSTAAPACPSCGRPFTQSAAYPAPPPHTHAPVQHAPVQHAPAPLQYAQPVHYAQPVQYVQPIVVAAPVYQPVPVYQLAPAAPPRSRALYVVLALFLGGLGIHNFYAGYNGRAAAQLVITLVTGLSGGFFLVAIWAFIECFVVNTDAYGRRMT